MQEIYGYKVPSDELPADASLGILLLDTYLNILSTNRAFLEMTLLQPEDVLGQPADILLPLPKLKERAREMLDGKQSKRTFSFYLRKKNLRVVMQSLVRLSRDGCLMLVVENMGAYKRARQLMQESKELLGLAVESMEDYAIFLLDPQGAISSWNPGAEKILGYSAMEIVGKPLSILFPAKDVEKGVVEREIRTAKARGRADDTRWLVRKNGKPFWASGILRSMREENGDLRGFVKILRDRTEQKQAERAQRRLNKRLSEEIQHRCQELSSLQTEMDTFFYAISHDLRAPLRAIDGFSHLLLDEYGEQLDTKGDLYLERVRVGCRRMGNLIDSLLDISRITRSQMYMTPVNLSRMAEIMAEELEASQPNRRVKFIVKADIVVQGDSRFLHTALHHLLDNAWKFTRDRELARIELGVKRIGGKRTFFVKDNGVGFDMEYVNKLFGVFQRLHGTHEFEGLGIGLATVQRIIHKHGGQIWAEGAIDQGATFFFTLK